MSNRNESTKRPCKLFKLLGSEVPDFCEKHFIPIRGWQNFCKNGQKCHNEYWRIIYNEKKVVNARLEDADKRLERLEKVAGFSK